MSICFSILWGVLFPVFSEYVTGEKQTVGIPYFNAVTIPLFLALILLMAIGPLISWRDNNLKKLVGIFIKPFIFSFAVGVLLVLCGITSFYPVLAYCLSVFVLLTLTSEFYKIYKKNKKGIINSDINLNTNFFTEKFSRINGLIVHLGVAVVTIAITASMAHKIEQEFTLGIGESYEIGKFRVQLNELYEKDEKNYLALLANLSVYKRKSDKLITELHPELRRYKRNDESTTEVALKMRPLEDIYIIVAGIDETGTKATLKMYINPLQVWLWVGGLIMVLGTAWKIMERRTPARL